MVGREHKVGEENYLLEHVLPAKAGKDKQGYVSLHHLEVLMAKYPKDIPILYRKVLDERPILDSSLLAAYVHDSKLSDKEKMDLFLYAAKHKDINHRLPALEALKDLDKKRFSSLLLTEMESLPEDTKDASYWTCPEAKIARLAIECDDPQVWKLLEKVAKRSVLGLRMELVNHFSDPKDPRHRHERLRLLASFLDDSALRDVRTNAKLGGPSAGFPYEQIEVRDFAALQIARLLGIEIELDPERTAEEWAKIRTRVQEALKLELGKTK